MKVAELEGAILDYWVALAAGSIDAKIEDWGDKMCVSSHAAFESVPFQPAINWSDGGPIVESEKMYLEYDADGYWVAHTQNSKTMVGPTALIAAMRAFVQCKFGDEVEEKT